MPIVLAQVLIMEAEILNNEGQSDAALALIEQAERRPDAIQGDCTPYCVKAGIMLNKVLSLNIDNNALWALLQSGNSVLWFRIFGGPSDAVVSFFVALSVLLTER